SDVKIKSIDETQISILDGSRSSLIDKIGFHYSHEILGQSAGHSLILCILQQKPNSVSDKLSTLSCPSKFRSVLTSSLESRIVHNTVLLYPTLFPGQVSISRFVKGNISDSPF